MEKSFSAGRAHGRGPTPRAVYRKDARGISSAEGWQMTSNADKMVPAGGEWSQEGHLPLLGR